MTFRTLHTALFLGVVAFLACAQLSFADVEQCKFWDQRDYRGTVSVTASGKPCQAWDSQAPARHTVNRHYFPHADLTNNHCRNANSEKRAWCFVADGSKRMEYCDVPCGRAEEDRKESCEWANGYDYHGKLSKTISGRTCQKWDENTPHRSSVNSKTHPLEDLKEHNYCRNPKNLNGLFCFTTDPKVRVEQCAVNCINKAPTFRQLRRQYPQGLSKYVKLRIGGEVDSSWLGLNTCAIRMSRVLNYNGLKIEKQPGGLSVQGNDNLHYIYRVVELAKWMRKNVGEPSVVGTAGSMEKFKGRKGIIRFAINVFKTATGHFDLWDGQELVEWRHQDTFTGLERGKWYFDHAQTVELWEF